MLVTGGARGSLYRLKAAQYDVEFHKLLWWDLLSGRASALLLFSTVPCSLDLVSALSSLDLSVK